MKILLFLKGILKEEDLLFNSDGKIKNREVKRVLNDFDKYALEMALSLKDKYGGEITAISMGDEYSKFMMKETLGYLVDEVILISDESFKNADTFVTANVLSKVATKVEFDIIICSTQSKDGNTGFIGPKIAGNLKIDHLNMVTEINYNDGNYTVTQEKDKESRVYSVKDRFLVTVMDNSKSLRIPNMKDVFKAIGSLGDEKLKIWDNSYLNISEDSLVSKTRISESRLLNRKREVEFIKGSVDQQVSGLFTILERSGVL